MAKFVFESRRVTEFEDYVEADTQEEATKLFDELIADDLNVVNQWFEFDVYGREVG